MPQLANIADDLAFVRKRIDQTTESVFPSTILFLWAGIVLAGSIITDLAPALGAAFWIVAGPSGGIVSAVLGWRWSIAVGAENMETARKQGLHWGGLLAALFISQLLVISGAMRGEAFGAQALLIAAIAYYYAGIHMHKSLLWLAGLQAGAFVASVLAPSLPETVIGVAMAAGFVSVGVIASRHVASGSDPKVLQ